jgi:hypothetical protein
MTDVSNLIRQFDPELAPDVNRPHSAHILEIVDELGCDPMVRGRTHGRG